MTLANRRWCWGDNKRGQLGGGPNEEFNPVVRDGHSFAVIGQGWDHTCGATLGGEGYCWGYNGYGQLGIGTLLNRSRPTKVIFP